MHTYYLAIDIGASSGRHILGHLENGRMKLEEIYRFPNGMTEKDGQKVWDVEELFRQIKTGMKKCKEAGKIPVSVGIDTWGVDFVLLDEKGERIGSAVAYRDGRTRGIEDTVFQAIPEEELYGRTGIQRQSFNTVYQLMALKKDAPEQLEQAETLLMIPDYFHYLLSGTAAAEYTEATTGQLVSPETKDWDFGLIRRLGYPERIFRKIVLPGTVLGNLRPEVREEVGYDCKVTTPASHDTASAVLAVPAEGDDVLYISSGTWSLMGTELERADCSEESRRCNLTNEGGYAYRFRYLKNIMGLWMIQSVKKEIGGTLGFGEICGLASKCEIASIVDCNEDRFLAPEHMTREVQAACRETGQPVPEGIGEVARVIYHSLAKCYAGTVRELSALTGKRFERIHIMGGGSNADYLNRLTAAETGLPVYAGPGEATAVGNLAAQMIAAGELKDFREARACVSRSFEIQVYGREA